MKSLKFVVAALVLCSSANYSLQAKDLVDTPILKGKVKSVITKELVVGEGIDDLIIISESEESYDAVGRLVGEKYLNSVGEILTSSNILYSTKTKQIELSNFSNMGKLEFLTFLGQIVKRHYSYSVFYIGC